MIHTSKLAPWHIAQAVKAGIAPLCFILSVQAAFWETWHAVWRDPR